MIRSLHRPINRPTNELQGDASVFKEYVSPNESLLEYGCGDGANLNAFRSPHKAGIEPNPDSAEIAIARGLDVRASIDRFTGRTFDRIIVSQDVRTLVEPQTELRRLGELLAMGGRLLIHQPVVADGPRQNSTEHRIHVQSLKTLLAAAKFEVESVSVKRGTHRSPPFRFANKPAAHFDPMKTYWTVKPFLTLVVVARHL